MKKFLLALFFTAFALTGAHAQPAQQSPAQPDVKPTILDPVANKRVAEISAQLRCLVCQNPVSYTHLTLPTNSLV